MRLPALFGDVVRYKFRETNDGGEDIIEIVGDASRERAEGLHLLRLAELLLGTPGLGDIEVDLQDCRRISGLIPLEGMTAEHDNLPAILCGLNRVPLPSGLLWSVPPCCSSKGTGNRS